MGTISGNSGGALHGGGRGRGREIGEKYIERTPFMQTNNKSINFKTSAIPSSILKAISKDPGRSGRGEIKGIIVHSAAQCVCALGTTNMQPISLPPSLPSSFPIFFIDKHLIVCATCTHVYMRAR